MSAQTLWQDFVSQTKSKLVPYLVGKSQAVYKHQSVVFFWVEGKHKRFFVSTPLYNQDALDIPTLTKSVSKRGDISGMVLVTKALHKSKVISYHQTLSTQQSRISIYLETATGLSETWFLSLKKGSQPVPVDPKGPQKKSKLFINEVSFGIH